MKPRFKKTGLTRRQALASAGTAAAAVLASGAGAAPARAREGPGRSGAAGAIAERIAQTPFVDTHEHLVEEASRTNWKPSRLLPCNDWALLFTHYLDSDLKVAGMAPRDYERFVAPDTPSSEKWRLLEPHWPAVKHTGYGRAVRLACEQLYGISELNAETIPRLAEAYTAAVKPGFYERILREVAGLESCQVNSLEAVFMETAQPRLLLQDLSIVAFGGYSGANWTWMTDADGQRATDLAGYHRVIDHWFARYGPYAVAVKSQTAYSRRLDFEDVPAERAAEPFRKLLAREPVTDAERKAFDDHIFWYCVRRATERQLPVKLHTGYYAGQNTMPLGRVSQNPADASELLRRAPETTFVLMHIGYPYHDAMIALAKHYANAVLDLCWTWIINPVAAGRFVQDFLAAAPANKLLTFGGDYIPVEPVVGHAAIARQGLARALEELVSAGALSTAEALELAEPLMRGNARRIFRLAEKERVLAAAPWTSRTQP
jgi:hypothetical protein